MRFSYFLALVLTLSIAGTYWYQSTAHICPVPVSYRLGEVDDSFTITRAEALEAIEVSTLVWEDALGIDLFTYDEDADLTVSFVFDERQESANLQASDEAELDEVASQNESIKSSIASLQASYDQQQTAFLERKEAYDQSVAEYNQQVQQLNDRGGATPDEFAELEATEVSLQSESATLRQQANELNTLAAELNELSATGNQLVRSYNQAVDRYNNRYGVGEEFTQGDYTGDEIRIYKFSNDNELVSVLAHEFGHALGIDHVDEVGSLMHYLLEEGTEVEPGLNQSDLTAFAEVCQLDTWQSQVRRVIRSVF